MTKKIVSILLVFSLAVSLFAGSALAAPGDANGLLTDFRWFAPGANGFLVPYPVDSSSYSVYLTNSNNLTFFNFLFVFTSPVSSGTINFGIPGSSGFMFASGTFTRWRVRFYDPDLNVLSDSGFSTSAINNLSIPSSSFYCSYTVYFTPSASFVSTRGVPFYPDDLGYNNLSYLSSGGGSGSGYDPSLDQDILAGVEAIARSLLHLETGPYSSTSAVSLNSDGIVTPTTRNDATLETLLNLIGVSSTYSSLAIEQMNLNFGNYFEYHEIEDTSSGTVTVVKNLPSYVNALGMELTAGINKLQRDNLMIYKQAENIEDALFTDKTENQPWSVAQWLKDIYTSITSFFSSFWSPAETDLKSASEAGMQAAADNGNVASGSQVDEVNSAADAFKSFGSTGNIGSGDVMDIFSDGASYDFFSQTTKDNLAYHPPAGSQRMLRSSSAPPQSDQYEEEYVDELDDKLSYWREVLGLP